MPGQLEDLDVSAAVAQTTVRIERSPRWVRAFLGGKPIADSNRALLALEPGRLPVYYFPKEHVRMDVLRPSDDPDGGASGPSQRHLYTLESNGRTVQDVGWSWLEPDAAHAQLKDHIAFYWAKLDEWFEEDEQVFVHPRDPRKRVDVMPSSRNVSVLIDREVIASTSRPHLLFETDLPTRYYIPRMDVRLELLEPSDTTTQCPYKGRAIYWSVRIGGRLYRDLVWSYSFPIPECPKIAQLLAFFNERVDIFVDGELQPQPVTPWS
jgi:uncharacterized protein (DUF427 family)